MINQNQNQNQKQKHKYCYFCKKMIFVSIASVQCDNCESKIVKKLWFYYELY